ncbi:MAG: hypothetical protein K2K89_08705 [Ruminococcus sp.]|nr:hypothetical protein [Ruminococcus sp.]
MAESSSVLEISIPAVSASAGSTVDVPIQISGNPGVIAMCVSIDYDSDLLQLTGVENCNWFSGGSFTISRNYSVKPFRIIWDNSLAEKNSTENGTFAVLHFKVFEDSASGLSGISVSTEKGNIFDVSLNDIAFKTLGGSIEISGKIASSALERTTVKSTESIESQSQNETSGFYAVIISILIVTVLFTSFKIYIECKKSNFIK